MRERRREARRARTDGPLSQHREGAVTEAIPTDADALLAHLERALTSQHVGVGVSTARTFVAAQLSLRGTLDPVAPGQRVVIAELGGERRVIRTRADLAYVEAWVAQRWRETAQRDRDATRDTRAHEVLAAQVAAHRHAVRTAF